MYWLLSPTLMEGLEALARRSPRIDEVYAWDVARTLRVFGDSTGRKTTRSSRDLVCRLALHDRTCDRTPRLGISSRRNSELALADTQRAYARSGSPARAISAFREALEELLQSSTTRASKCPDQTQPSASQSRRGHRGRDVVRRGGEAARNDAVSAEVQNLDTERGICAERSAGRVPS